MPTRHNYIHPALRAAVDAITPAPLSLTTGPLDPGQPVTVDLAYPDLIQNLAERAPEGGFDTVRDLPVLGPIHIAAALQHYPDALLEALAHFEPTNSHLCKLLTDASKPLSHCYASIGVLVLTAVRSYIEPIVLRDVRIHLEHKRRGDAIERDGAAAEERAAVRQGQRS